MGFKKGRSGNPAGRPKGIEDKRTALRTLLEPHAPKLIEKAVTLALEGDGAALRMCLDRLVPSLKAREEPVVTPWKGGGTIQEQSQAIIDAARAGDLPPDQAASFVQALAAQAQIVKVDELVRRMKDIEEKLSAKRP